MQTGESAKPITGADVERHARSFVGTPFLHQGRRKGHGVDCVGLVLCVAEDLGLVDRDGRKFLRADYYDYGMQPAGRFVHDECAKRLIVKPQSDLTAGDVLSLRVPHLPTHTAIVALRGEALYIIHAYNGAGSVVEHILSEPWRRRIIGSFTFPGVV